MLNILGPKQIEYIEHNFKHVIHPVIRANARLVDKCDHRKLCDHPQTPIGGFKN